MLLLLFLLPFLRNVSLWYSLPTFFTILLTVAYFYIKRRQSVWTKRGVKHVKPTFLVGSMEFKPSISFFELMQKFYNELPNERYVGIYQFLKPILVVKDPELIKLITVKEFDHFKDHQTAVDPDVDPFWSKNLFASRGEKWHDLRTTLSPSFTSSKMKTMFALIDECAQRFVEYFKNGNSEITELEMKDTFTRYTNDVIATTAFGLKCNSLENKTNEFYMMGKEVTNIFKGTKMFKFFIASMSPTLAKVLRITVVPKKLSSYFSKIIVDTVETREKNKIIRPDMIHLLMQAMKGQEQKEEVLKVGEEFSSVAESNVHSNRHKKEITIDDVVSQAFIFFFAGFETISTALTFTFYELAVNTDIQDKLREECLTVSDQVTYESLLSLKYLDMVVSEALRKWPPAVGTDRQVTKNFTVPPVGPDEKPLLLEKGDICSIPIAGLHHDPKYFPNPEKFDPERFSDENKHKINTAAYMPFGAGPRNCIGSRFALLEAKLIIFYILRSFEVIPIKRTSIPLVLDPQSINPACKGGMWLGFKPIHKNKT